ncbi:MAG: hypothetical protein ACJ8AT_15055 [Hyalangium sp.]|uniref:hypothetical protein n=1 Tax=Hyalangium sp. TaxID=2028555 RepID=UPI00389AEA4A
MKKLPLLTVLFLTTCVRSQVFPPSRPQYDESIKFPKTFLSGGVPTGKPHENLLIDGAIAQAVMIVAKDFIPPPSKNFPCWTKPSDFFFSVIRQDNIIFVEISPNYFAEGCELKPAPLDWGAKYAISVDGHILRRAPSDEPDEPGEEIPSPSSPDAGENGDGGYRRLYDLPDLVPMISGPVDNPPFFTRPEWMAEHHWPLLPYSPPDGGTPDGGTPDGGLHTEGGAPAPPSR